MKATHKTIGVLLFKSVTGIPIGIWRRILRREPALKTDA
jgi:hypothetical protein